MHNTTLKVSTQIEIRHHLHPQVEDMERNEDEDFTRTSHRLEEVGHQYIFYTRCLARKRLVMGNFHECRMGECLNKGHPRHRQQALDEEESGDERPFKGSSCFLHILPFYKAHMASFIKE
ncbi:hypothetical protein C1H46_003001 [Malus baccata]|uniref:Uncharacterized protein n=1 Tax=Malus baccata TaxID=106549 RepID=A0A540NK78_MALBA|nr:hypothetical protein C1H46_003001 [Malus baccata]